MTQIRERITQRQGKTPVHPRNEQQSGDDIAAPLRLPFKRVRPEQPPFLEASHSFTLSKPLMEELRQTCLPAHISLHAFLFAAFQTLLYRYTLREHFICGFAETTSPMHTPLSAICTDLTGEMRVEELLQQVQSQSPQHYTLEQQDAYPSGKEQDPHSLQVVFHITDYRGDDSVYRRSSAYTRDSDVIFELCEQSGGQSALYGSINYNADLFDGTTIARMAEHYQNLLEGMQRDRSSYLYALPLLTNDEHEHLLVDRLYTRPDSASLVHQKFAQWAQRTPHALAVTSDTRTLCYHDLNVQANQVAHHLQTQGVTLETPVLICMPRAIELVIGLLAILKAGGTYIPVDPSTPPERLAFFLQDAHASIVLTTRELASAFSSYTGQLLFLPDAAYDTERADDPVSAVSDRNAAYIIYTSGSTGQPKGVQVEHQGLSNLLLWHQRAFAITPHDRASQVAGINFDATGWEIWPYLTAGASVHFIDEETRITPEKLQTWLIAHGITIGFLPTPLMESIQNLNWPAASPLRALLTGGDKLHHCPSPALPFAVVNNYGPTENTVVSTSVFLPKEEGTEEAPSIGSAIDNTTTYILDPWMNPVPVGVAGELYVGGIGLARGYHHRPDLTAERFVPNPFGCVAEARLYRTGDQVRYRLDGTIEFLERIDSQVKIRGFRIELGEIETTLVNHPAIADAIVLAQEDSTGEKSLTAYLIASGSSPAIHELRNYLHQRLPHYMIPSDFVWMDQFPLTLNGKVDRRRLPAAQQNQREETSVPPSTDVERALTTIWQDLMHIELLSVNTSFFELGGYSLLATQIIARIRHVLAIEVPLQQFLQTPTVAALARYIEQHQHDASRTLSLSTRHGQESAPLSFAQQRLWFLHQLAPQSAFYNIPIALRLRGPLHVARLEHSLDIIIQRHEIMRTTFPTRHGEPVQVIANSTPIGIFRFEVEPGELGERVEQAMHLVNEQAQLPFDLARGPLLRVALVSLSEQDHILLISMHHSITDGWSVGVFFRELEVCYRSCMAGEQPQLPPLAIQYADFACWQRQWLQGETLAPMLQYWTQQLQDAPPLTPLPLKPHYSRTQTFRGATLDTLLPKSLLQALVAVSNQEQATPFMALLAAFKMLLCSYTGQVDLSIGTPLASRTSVELEPLIGFFVNTLVLRTNLAGDPTYRQVLQRVRSVALQAYAHQDLPLERLVEALHIQRDIDRNPLFQVVFALQDAPDAAPAIEGVTVEPVAIQLETAPFDLTVEVKEGTEGVVVSANYNTDLFDSATVQQFLRDYQQLLCQVSSDPSIHLSDLSPSELFAAAQTFNDANSDDDQAKRASVARSTFESADTAQSSTPTPLQAILITAWTRVLKRTDITIWDNFFEVGGHSLLATQLISRLQDLFQMDLSVKIIFQAPTVVLLAEELVRFETFPGQLVMTAEIYEQVNELSNDEAYAALQQRKNEGK